MAIAFEDFSEDFRLIKLSGRLDVKGTSEIESKFTSLAATASKKVLVDLREVSFLASIAIRAIITNAKALQLKAGRIAGNARFGRRRNPRGHRRRRTSADVH
jgi:anti-sigma B factor antagonist